MAMRRATMGTVLALAVMGLVMSAMGALIATRTVSNTGNIVVVTPSPSPSPGPSPSPSPSPSPTVQIGTYADSGCTTVLSSITWGTLSPGVTANATMYLRNEGNVAVTLSIQAANWNPASAASYLTFGWNCTGCVLQPNQVVQALLSLNVSSSISGVTSFSFNITITAAQ